MFLMIQTSPGNHQAWLAMPGEHDREFACRVRRAAGGDLTASGAKNRRQPEFQGQVRTRFSTRDDPRSTARTHHQSADSSAWVWSRRWKHSRRSPLPGGRFRAAPTNGRATASASTARHAIAAVAGPTAAGPIRMVHDRAFVGPRHRRNRRASSAGKSQRHARKEKSYATQTARQAAAAVERHQRQQPFRSTELARR